MDRTMCIARISRSGVLALGALLALGCGDAASGRVLDSDGGLDAAGTDTSGGKADDPDAPDPTRGDTTGAGPGDDDGPKLDVGDGTGGVPEDETDGQCMASTVEGSLDSVPVDIIVAVDTSGTMDAASAAVEASINVDFAQILEDSGIDYQVIVFSQYGSGDEGVCVGPPLSGAPCNPVPGSPAMTERYKHYDRYTGSSQMLGRLQGGYDAADDGGNAPNGWSQWLRPNSHKVFLVFTDTDGTSNDTAVGDQWDAALLALDPAAFGTAQHRNYRFHSIMGIIPNDPVSAPWMPDDPLHLSGSCGNGDHGPGGSMQQVSVLSNGLRFPVCYPENFDVVFEEIAQDVLVSTPMACSFPIPTPESGDPIDPNTLEIDIVTGDETLELHQVGAPDLCEPDAFFVGADDLIYLCPQVCDVAQADPTTTADVRYGCDVGFDPAG